MMTGSNRSKLALGGVVLAAVALLAVNLFSSLAFKSIRVDFTEEGLYTLSDETQAVLRSLKEPITMRLYFSKILGERSPSHAIHYGRVRELLERYVSLSDGDIRLEIIDPEPFSDAEDRAVAAGLQGVAVTPAGDQGYFGLTVAGSTDLEAAIPFFALERESFVEYDLTKLIYTLANPQKKTIGLISTLPVDGRDGGPMRPPARRWVIMSQIREFFDVRIIGEDSAEIPADIETLMVVHPKGLTQQALYAIDQFVLRGGNALVFVDPAVQAPVMGGPQLQIKPQDAQDVNKMLAVWGLRLIPGEVAGDLDLAHRVSTGDPARPVVADYVAWLRLGPKNFDATDVITADLDLLVLAAAGILERRQTAGVEVTPLLFTSPNSMKIKAGKIQGEPDILKLLRDFKPSGKPLMLAARVRGRVKTAFPGGLPEKKGSPAAIEEKTDHLTESKEEANLIVVADVDMLYDTFWVRTQQFFGQEILTPTAKNGVFALNALDVLAGSDALVGLRGRGKSDRPFEMVKDIRREAERRFRNKEEALLAKLDKVQKKMSSLRSGAKESSDIILSAADQEELARLRLEMVGVRKELRTVQHELRRDIESLEAWLKFFNIAGLPLLLGLGTLIFWLVRRRRAA